MSGYVVETRIPGMFDWTAVNDTPLVPAETSLSLFYPKDQVPELVTASFRVGGNLYPQPTEYSNEAQQHFSLRPPKDLALGPGTSGTALALQWTNLSEKAEEVVIERQTVLPDSADHDWIVAGSVATPATQFVDLSFPDASRVQYRIRAVKGADSSDPTEMRINGLLDTPPRPPANFTATGTADGIQLSWTNRTVMATELVLFRAPADATNFKQLELVHLPPDSTAYVDLPPQPGAYGYWLEPRGPELFPDGVDATTAIGYLPPKHDPPFRATVTSLPFWTGDPVTDVEGHWILCGVPGAVQPPAGPPSDLPGTEWATPCASAAADGTLHAVYVDGSVLRHLTYVGGVWSTETIATDPLGLGTAAQVLDSQGHLLVAWIDGNAQLWFARQAPAGWSPELVPGVVANPVSLRMTVDAAGDPHLSVRDTFRVLHVTRSGGGSWTVESLLPEGILPDSLDAWILSGGGGDLEILFSARASGPDQLLEFDRSGGIWTGPTAVGPVVRMRAAGSPDHRRAAVLVAQPDRLRLREWLQGHWSETALDVPEVDPGAAGFDGSNRLHLLVPAGPRNWALIDEVP